KLMLQFYEGFLGINDKIVNPLEQRVVTFKARVSQQDRRLGDAFKEVLDTLESQIASSLRRGAQVQDDPWICTDEIWEEGSRHYVSPPGGLVTGPQYLTTTVVVGLARKVPQGHPLLKELGPNEFYESRGQATLVLGAANQVGSHEFPHPFYRQSGIIALTKR